MLRKKRAKKNHFKNGLVHGNVRYWKTWDLTHVVSSGRRIRESKVPAYCVESGYLLCVSLKETESAGEQKVINREGREEYWAQATGRRKNEGGSLPDWGGERERNVSLKRGGWDLLQ